MDEKDLQKIISRLRKICSKSEKCSSDIYNYLQKSECTEDEKDMIIEILEKENFISESRYVEAFVNDKIKFNKWGKLKIRYFLEQKGISEKLINSALKNIDETFYEETLKSIITSKVKSLKNENPEKIYEKVFKFAQLRGFENNLIYRVLQSILR
ncbi:MAG: regulatory protein RecX [Bacteroidales bacterium]